MREIVEHFIWALSSLKVRVTISCIKLKNVSIIKPHPVQQTPNTNWNPFDLISKGFRAFNARSRHRWISFKAFSRLTPRAWLQSARSHVWWWANHIWEWGNGCNNNNWYVCLWIMSITQMSFNFVIWFLSRYIEVYAKVLRFWNKRRMLEYVGHKIKTSTYSIGFFLHHGIGSK